MASTTETTLSGADTGAGTGAAKSAAAGTPATGQRLLTGKVVSSKMDKTIAVSVERLVKHPTYGKTSAAPRSFWRTTPTTSARKATEL